MEPGPQPLILRQWKNHLPHDVVLNILATLPVKPLVRFKCVSKLWDSSITSPNFISTHLNIVNNKKDDNDHAYLIQTCIRYNSPKIPITRKVLCFDRTFDSLFEYSVPSVFDLNTSFLIGSCNGLVCLAQLRKLTAASDAIYLWNPSIRKFKRLPDSCSSRKAFWLSPGLGYQSKTNDYKVVKLWGTPVVAEVYTLSSDSWRKVEISLRAKVVVTRIEPYPFPLFFSGALHWFAYHSEGERKFLDPTMILLFDVNNEKFREMALPDGDKLIVQYLSVFKGDLAFISCGYPENDDDLQSDSQQCFIWVMRDYGVDESWNKLFSIRFENANIIFFGCTENGELLLDKKVKEESEDGGVKIDESTILSDDTTIVSLDPETLHEKDLGILRYVTHIVTTFKESLVLLDGATGLSG
ncbi:F-box/kelch-repeat protein At3g06240-like [Quercus suber]|uniref:F-box/kelch-repeat protein At3g06240-like n=1 Tax=Quercus suber TaxID=58331 RepID=UPI0032DE96AD